MEELHLIGLTTDRRGLILGSRQPGDSSRFVVPLNDELLSLVEELVQDLDSSGQSVPAGESTPASTAFRTQPVQLQSRMSVRDIQAGLRAGESAEALASRAGVTPEWIERFATPVRAEQRAVIDRALRTQPVAGDDHRSALTLRQAAERALAQRGTTVDSEAFEAAWSARLVDRDHWVVAFHFTQQGRPRVVEWDFDTTDDRLVPRDRVAGHFGPGSSDGMGHDLQLRSIPSTSEQGSENGDVGPEGHRFRLRRRRRAR